MTIQLIIPGRDEALEPFRVRLRGGAEAPPTTDLLNNIEVAYAFDLSTPARAAAKGVALRVVEVEDDGILRHRQGALRLLVERREWRRARGNGAYAYVQRSEVTDLAGDVARRSEALTSTAHL